MSAARPFPTVLSPDIKAQAAAGYFRAIALWVNHPLVNSGIVVQVQGAKPGCLRLQVEYERPPLKERLVKLLCHRIWQLNSTLIEGVQIEARQVGQRRCQWQQRVRIVPPARRRRPQPSAGRSQPQPLPVRPLAAAPTALPPQIATPAHLNSQHTKLLRSLLLAGSAMTAFVFGCMLDLLTAGSGPVLPSFSTAPPPTAAPAAAAPHGEAPAPRATPVTAATEAAPRPPLVDAALEPVAVITHRQPSASDDDDVTLLFGGDISLHQLPMGEDAAQIFDQLEAYQTADLSMVTLGSPLASGASNLEADLYQQTPLDSLEILRDSGVDIVNLNHHNTMAFGEKGLDETLDLLDQAGLYRVGAGRNAMEARRPEIIDVKGRRIAYLSYAQGGDEAAHDQRAGINTRSKLGIVQDIQALRDEVDWIVVNFRWQVDLPPEPASWQTNLARLAIDQGADVVVGYHPTQLQGAEVYKNRPIAYSLGDFVFETSEPAADQDTAMLQVALQDEQMRVELVPVEVRDRQPTTMTGRRAEALLDKLAQVSSQFEVPMASSVVLDLQAPAPATPPTDPHSPFVGTPQETVPPQIDPQQADPLAAPPPAPLDLTAPSGITPNDPAPRDTNPKETLDSAETETHRNRIPWFNRQPQNQDALPDWGPKVAPDQTPFTPIPDQPTETPTVPDAESARRHRQIWGPTEPSYPATLDRTPDQSPEQFPEQPAGITAAPAPQPSGAPVEDLGTAPTENPGEDWGENLAPDDQANPQNLPAVEALPAQAEPAPSPAVPTQDAVSPHREPLIGPLGALPSTELGSIPEETSTLEATNTTSDATPQADSTSAQDKPQLPPLP